MHGRITLGACRHGFDAGRALTGRPAVPSSSGCTADLSDDLHRPLRRATLLAAVAVLVSSSHRSFTPGARARGPGDEAQEWTAGSDDPVEALAFALEHSARCAAREAPGRGTGMATSTAIPTVQLARVLTAKALSSTWPLPSRRAAASAAGADEPQHAAPAALAGQLSGRSLSAPRVVAGAAGRLLRLLSNPPAGLPHNSSAHGNPTSGLLGQARLRAASRARPGGAGCREAPAGAAPQYGEEIQVTAHYENAVGARKPRAAGTITRSWWRIADPETGRVLELVPGLVITQHSGAA